MTKCPNPNSNRIVNKSHIVPLAQVCLAVAYLVVTSADFTPAASFGTFTDFISAFNFFVVGPAPESSTVSQTFDPGLLTGIGSFAIDSGASPGAMAIGDIVLDYDLFSLSPNDPSFNPDTDTVSVGNELSAAASVSVIGSVPIPEPSTLLLIGVGLAAVWLVRKKVHEIV